MINNPTASQMKKKKLLKTLQIEDLISKTWRNRFPRRFSYNIIWKSMKQQITHYSMWIPFDENPEDSKFPNKTHFSKNAFQEENTKTAVGFLSWSLTQSFQFGKTSFTALSTSLSEAAFDRAFVPSPPTRHENVSELDFFNVKKRTGATRNKKSRSKRQSFRLRNAKVYSIHISLLKTFLFRFLLFIIPRQISNIASYDIEKEFDVAVIMNFKVFFSQNNSNFYKMLQRNKKICGDDQKKRKENS